MTQSRIRLALIDAHRVAMEPLKERLGQEPDLQVVAAATDAKHALSAIVETCPQVLVMDVNFSEPGPFELIASVSLRLPDIKVLFLTSFLSDILLEQALRIRNTRGYILKDESVESLIQAIRVVAKGEYWFSQKAQGRLVFDPSEQHYAVLKESCLHELTSRQLEVLRHLANGESVKEVARSMHLSEKSVDSHKYRIMHKLNIHDRVGLARYAIREGLLLP